MTKYDGFLQWKFTACRYNIENSNGFNTFSMSEGLSRDDKEDLIRFAGSYAPPDHLPYRPTREEIETLFPIVFSSFPLRSGKWAVARSVYVGKDYAGSRWGNFFSHAVVSPNPVWPFHTVRLWNSPLFADGLTEEELREQTPPPLPPLAIDEADLCDFSATIPRFLAGESFREQAIRPLIDAVRDFPTSGKTALLRDEPENIVHWIAAVQYAFPFRLSSGITFITYMHALSGSLRFHVTGTSLEGNVIPLRSPSLNATCRVFDFPEERVPDPPEQKSRIYTDSIRIDEADYPGGELAEPLLFLNRLDCRLHDNSPEKGLLLYRYLYQPWVELPAAKTFEAVLGFFSTQPLPVRQSLMREQILKRDTLYSPEMLEILFPHLLDVVIKSDVKSDAKSEIAPGFYDFLIRQFARDIASPDATPDSIVRFQLIEKILARMPNDTQKNFFEHVHQHLAASPNPKRYLFLYLSTLLCLFADQAEAYRGYFKILFDVRFDEKEFARFVNDVIDSLIDKATSPAVFEQIVKLHLANVPSGKGEYDFIDDYDYVPRLKRYGLNQWREGVPAQKQGAAFLRYVLGIPKEKDEWKAWEYHANIMVYLLEIPFIDNKGKKSAFETIVRQMADERMPLDRDEIRHLKIDLLHYTAPLQRLGEMVSAFWNEHRGLSVFFIMLCVLVVVVSIALWFRFG